MLKNATEIAVLNFENFVSLLDGNKSCRFVSLLYRAKETGELAKHTILLNVRRERCLKVDLENLQRHRPSLKGIMAEAADELIESINETLTTGHNSRYTKQGYYDRQGNGNVQVSVKLVAYVRGYQIRKEIVERGHYKRVMSRPLTIAKNKLRGDLKNTRCREFIITPENFKMARLEGKVIVIDASGSSLSKIAGLAPIAMSVPVSA